VARDQDSPDSDLHQKRQRSFVRTVAAKNEIDLGKLPRLKWDGVRRDASRAPWNEAAKTNAKRVSISLPFPKSPY